MATSTLTKLVRTVASFGLLCGLSALLSPLVAKEATTLDAAKDTEPAAFERQVRPLLERYCVDCHFEADPEAGIAFDGLETQADALKVGKTWRRVLDALEGGIMPPAEMDQPESEEVKRIIDWIENDFFEAQCSVRASSAPVVVRRLNRQEYDNTIRDLTGLDLRLAAGFPPDDIGFGYDNIGSALKISPIHIEKCLEAAEKATEAAIVLPDARDSAPAELIGLRTYELPPAEAVEFEHALSPGRYLVDFSLVRVGVAEAVAPPRLEISFGTDTRNVEAVGVQDETVLYRFWLQAAEGDKVVRVALAPGEAERADVVAPKETNALESGDQRYGGRRGLHVDSMVVRGPVNLKREDLPESHRRVLTCTPDFGDASRLECARRVITRFAERAFRRPVPGSEVDGLLRMFRLASGRGESYERAVQIALTTVLVSPQFLFLLEPDESREDRPLTEFELASRLAYFLWSSMPDEELFRQARDGTLRTNLREQVLRMLEDSRSDAFVENFTGQWLQLRKLGGVTPDEKLFPGFDASLRESMRKETERFFAHLLRTDGSVLELLDSDYTFLNETLAAHYEIEGVSGETFRRVSLADGRRGGVLTQASVLTLTSNPNRTSPVKRGQWVLERLLGTPPPPPPPEVEALDESPRAAETASLRERLELHRSRSECASCHDRMDPLGFALESYDAIGRFRTSDGEFPIDASGELVGGRKFQDAEELKQLLKSSATKRFSRCLIENLLTYALGRGLEIYDQCAVEAIRRQLAASSFRFRAILFGIVESRAFQYRGVAP